MKNLKKIASLMLAVLMLALVCLPVAADDDSANVTVTVANGEIVLANAEVNVADIDGDGSLTINDALYAAHDAYYDGGAAAGYGSENGQWGLSLTKLWGVANGGSYGYYLNNSSAYSLTDTVKNGDNLYAFVYTDTIAFSDAFCYFDKSAAESSGVITLTLFESGFDASWNPVSYPLAGAEITVDGENTGILTDADGKATVTVDGQGSHTISASVNGRVIVPPICTVTVAPSVDTGDGEALLPAIFALAALACTAMAVKGRKITE